MQALSRSFFNDPNNGLFIQFMFHRTLSTTWRQLFAAYQFFKISQLDTLWMHTVSNLSANSCTAAIMPCAWGILVDGLLICPGYIPRNLSANFLHKLYKSHLFIYFMSQSRYFSSRFPCLLFAKFCHKRKAPNYFWGLW